MDSLILAQKIATEFERMPNVDSIALGGSHGSQRSEIIDRHSDIDLYIYGKEIVPVIKRKAIIEKFGASHVDLNLTFWGTGDEWIHQETGIEVDIIFWSPTWIEEQLERVVTQHQASIGYTTCFWRTVKNSRILYDRTGWFATLKEKTEQPYPEELKRAIIAINHPLLRSVIPSYYSQIKKALSRGDLLSVNHRIAAFFASYFDTLFALNEVLHPGEKKLMQHIALECIKVPEDIDLHTSEILRTASIGDSTLLTYLDKLLDKLDELLQQESLI